MLERAVGGADTVATIDVTLFAFGHGRRAGVTERAVAIAGALPTPARDAAAGLALTATEAGLTEHLRRRRHALHRHRKQRRECIAEPTHGAGAARIARGV